MVVRDTFDLRVIELIDAQARPSGRYRMAAVSSDGHGSPEPLCRCENGHESQDAAWKCSEAQVNALRA